MSSSQAGASPLPTVALEPDDDEDDYNRRINKTGCGELNTKVLLCYADTRDWRKCQNELRIFRECFENHQKSLAASSRSS